MKRILCAVLLILLIFTGCSNKESKMQPLSAEFSENVKIRHKSVDFEAQLEHGTSQTKIIYSRPKALGGLTLVKEGESCTAQLAGMSVDIKENILTDSSAIFLIDKVLKSLFSETAKLEMKQQDNTVIISGSVENEKFEAVRYKDTPKLISLSIPSQELTIIFEKAENE